jgi:hypothetical protein
VFTDKKEHNSLKIKRISLKGPYFQRAENVLFWVNLPPERCNFWVNFLKNNVFLRVDDAKMQEIWVNFTFLHM